MRRALSHIRLAAEPSLSPQTWLEARWAIRHWLPELRLARQAMM